MAVPIAAKAALQVAQSKTGRRIIGAIVALVFVIATLPVGLIGGAALALGAESEESCEIPASETGFSREQMQNAQSIFQTAKSVGAPIESVQVALMVALVESELLNLANSTVPESLDLPHQGTPGDNHDSVGIMQQRPSQGWGTVAELMTPAFAARAFFGGPDGPNGGSPAGLLDIDGWQEMTAGEAAQSVQQSAAPTKYEERSEDALKLLGASLLNGLACEEENSGGTPPKVSGGWANPVGMQQWATYENHAGGAMDVHVGVGTPVYAPAAGRIFDLSESCGGQVLGVQHDVQFTTVFAHLSKFAVRPGQQVKAGELIGYSGASGSCVDGAHLHFEVRVGPNPNNWGSFTPAYKFMREAGITMGPCVGGCDLYPM